MRKIKKTSLILMMLISYLSAFNQITKEFPKEINSISMTAPGVAVVATDDALYGIDKDGKELWKNEKLKKMDVSKIEILEGSEFIFITSFRGSFLINVINGELYGADGVVYGARVVHGANQVWVIRKYNAIEVWDIASKKALYKLDKIGLPFGLNSSNQTDSQAKNFIGVQPIAYVDNETAILHLGLGQLGEYNLLTGDPIWNFDWKPYKVKKPNGEKGDRPSDIKRGYGVMKLDNPTNTLYFPFREMLIAIDTKTGKAKWDIKANKTGKVNDIYIIDEGVVVRTPKGIQLIDKETGMTKWDKPIKVKGSKGLLVNNEGTFYVVSKNSIEKIDISKRTSETLAEKIKFEGDDSFSSLELINGVVVLSGSQNVIGINKESGEMLFTTYYKAPGASFKTIAQNIALAGIAMTATYNSYDNNSRAGNKTYYQYTPAMRSNGGTGSTEGANNLYIKTKFKDAETKGTGIAKVNKETGETTNKLVLENKEPIYVVDENSGVIFFNSGKTSLTIKEI